MDKEKRFWKADAFYDQGRFRKSFSRFLALAERGHVPAMERLAVMYGAGHGTKYDFDESLRWDLRAIELGSEIAMFNMAVSYRRSGDVRNAKAWFERALQTMMVGDAALELAKMYLISDLEHDRVRHYLTTALQSDLSEGDREDAQALLASLDGTVTPRSTSLKDGSDQSEGGRQ